MRFLVVLLLLVSATAAAQDPPARYRETFMAGSEAWQAERFAEARTRFIEAHELFPNARTHRVLGLVLFELREYVDCVEHLAASLVDERRPLNATQRGEAQRVLRLAGGFVGRIRITTNVVAFLEVDGEPHPLQDLIVVEPGNHTFRLTSTGYETETRRILVRQGDDMNLRIDLVQAEGAGGPEPDVDPDETNPFREVERRPTGDPTTGEPEDDVSSPLFTVGTASVIGGGALIVMGLASHLMRNDAQDAHQASVDMGGCLPLVGGNVPDGETRPECEDFEKRWQRTEPLMYVGYGLGAALAVTGVVLMIIAPSDGDDSRAVHCGLEGTIGLRCGATF